jgi:hypothetical protein
MFIFNGVTGTPEWISKFSSDFAALEMMPSLVSRPNIYLGFSEHEQAANVNQLNFVTAQKDLTLAFDTDRYIFQMNIIPARKLPSIEEFIEKAEDVVRIVSKSVEGKANRMAFVTTGICSKMDSARLNEIHKNLFNFPDVFGKNEVVEWQNRQVYRIPKDINGKSELLNVILNLNRIQMTHHFEHKPTSFDGIEVGFDINTYQGNLSQRFSADDTGHFLHEVNAIENNLECSLLKLFGD